MSCFLRGLSLYLLSCSWVSGFGQSFGTYECQKLICRDCGGQSSDYFAEEGQSLMFPSILKRLQSDVFQLVGDTTRVAVIMTMISLVKSTNSPPFTVNSGKTTVARNTVILRRNISIIQSNKGFDAASAGPSAHFQFDFFVLKIAG